MIGFLADWLLLIIVAVAAIAIIIGINKTERLQRFGVIAMVAMLCLVLARLANFLPIETTRPFVEAGVAPGASYMNNPGFPSDHSLLAFTCAYAVIFMTKFKKIGWTLFVLAVLVSVGRILALVHTPLDVLGGFLVASLTATCYVGFLRGRQFLTTKRS
jgi:undecaprenyl-diphosphatase